jgi:hypothetical protein
MPKTLDFTGFFGILPLKKKAVFTRHSKKSICFYMFLYSQARPDLMRAGVCVIIPNEARAISFTGRTTRRGRLNLYGEPKRTPPGNATNKTAKFKGGIDHSGVLSEFSHP